MAAKSTDCVLKKKAFSVLLFILKFTGSSKFKKKAIYR